MKLEKDKKPRSGAGAVVFVLGSALCAGVLWWQLQPDASQQEAVMPDAKPALAAQVGDTAFPQAAVDVFVRLAHAKQPEITRRAVLDSLIEDHLFASADFASGGHHEGHGGSDRHRQHGGSESVAYSDEARFENQLFRIARQAWPEEIHATLRAMGADDPTKLYVSPPRFDEARLREALTLKPGLYATMSAEQSDAAQKIELVRYRLVGGREASVSLDDVYRRQNIQLKVQMHSLNLEFLRQALRQHVATHFVIDWVRHGSDLSEADATALERMVQERLEREEVMHALGMLQDIHDDNVEMRKLAAQVTQAEVADYYEAHRDEFQRVERVRARHIQLGSQEQADRVHAEIKAGLAFEEAVRRYSLAGDKHGKVPGNLGWIERDDRNTHWLRSVAFVQPEKQVSTPFRSPGAGDVKHTWEIVFLDEKITGYQEVDSEGVRYEASKAIARRKLVERAEETRKKLWDTAQISYDEQWLGQAG